MNTTETKNRTAILAEIAALALPNKTQNRVCVVSKGTAQKLMGAPVVAGGWIAVSLPLNDETRFADPEALDYTKARDLPDPHSSAFVALLPDGMHYGRKITAAQAREILLAGCGDQYEGTAEELADILAKLRSII